MNDITILEIIIFILKCFGAVSLLAIAAALFAAFISWFVESVSENQGVWLCVAVIIGGYWYYAA